MEVSLLSVVFIPPVHVVERNFLWGHWYLGKHAQLAVVVLKEPVCERGSRFINCKRILLLVVIRAAPYKQRAQAGQAGFSADHHQLL